jgi:hypothetical protein
MKKFLLTISLILCFRVFPIYAQDSESNIPNTETETVTEEDIENENIDDTEVMTEEEMEEETQKQREEGTLSQDLEVNEETQDLNFLSILFAVLTPALLIIVAYLLIRMSSK